MKVVSLDVHAESSQMFVSDENGEVVVERKVSTDADSLRNAILEIPGEKCVIFEEGPLSAFLNRSLEDIADKVISCDPAYNALIARDESSNDQRDARHLEKLFRVGSIQSVYIPPEPYFSLRSLVSHRVSVQSLTTQVKNRIKALARRYGLKTQGKKLYQKERRGESFLEIDSEPVRWQMESQWRQLDMLEAELEGSSKRICRFSKKLPIINRLQMIPGVGPIISATLVAWIADPWRFKNRKKLSSYAGLGLGQGITNWKPVGRSRASRRGNRHLKRVLFLAAKAAGRSDSALGRRYRVRKRNGWETTPARRDIARKILYISCSIWKNGSKYDDRLVNGPQLKG